jgi:hypothetical protein
MKRRKRQRRAIIFMVGGIVAVLTAVILSSAIALSSFGQAMKPGPFRTLCVVGPAALLCAGFVCLLLGMFWMSTQGKPCRKVRQRRTRPRLRMPRLTQQNMLTVRGLEEVRLPPTSRRIKKLLKRMGRPTKGAEDDAFFVYQLWHPRDQDK